MRRLILCLFVVCSLLEHNFNYCTVNSTEEHHIADSFSVSKDHRLKNGKNANEQQRKNDFGEMKSSIFKAMINIDHSKSIDDVIKTMQQFPIEILNVKPVHQLRNKLKKEFNNVVAKGKTVLQMAHKLEKIGKNKTKKQVAEFNSKLKNLKKIVRKFTQKFNLESKKQRDESLKIAKNHPTDIKLFRRAKNNVNIIDLLYDMITVLKGLPNRIKCLINGDCNQDNNSEDDNEDNDDDDDEEENSEYDDVEY